MESSKKYHRIEIFLACIGIALALIPLLMPREGHENPFPDEIVTNMNNHELFTLNVVIPVLERLGCKEIEYHPIQSIFGVDITFIKPDPLDNKMYSYGVGILTLDVTEESQTAIDSIAASICRGFKQPYQAKASDEIRFICRFLVITSKMCTPGAQKRILSKIDSPSMRNNVRFLDSKRLVELSKRKSEM
jgi:hypothetical protein